MSAGGRKPPGLSPGGLGTALGPVGSGVPCAVGSGNLGHGPVPGGVGTCSWCPAAGTPCATCGIHGGIGASSGTPLPRGGRGGTRPVAMESYGANGSEGAPGAPPGGCWPEGD